MNNFSEKESKETIAFRKRIEGTNINHKTLLATDYLNHFNEIIMLFDMIPDMPEIIEDCKEWKPICYKEHFKQSNFPDSLLAIEAYDLVQTEYRESFENAVVKMNILIAGSIVEIEKTLSKENKEILTSVVSDVSTKLQQQINVLSAVIHGSEEVMKQIQIDSLMNTEGFFMPKCPSKK
ncbi:MAG: hypothetical protein KAJ75_10015 [Alphaproteobacteria bacterium]|nr:hypothetical protein [Alphaproteobacteria bacterium]